jgi:hypothetical protein
MNFVVSADYLAVAQNYGNKSTMSPRPPDRSLHSLATEL